MFLSPSPPQSVTLDVGNSRLRRKKKASSGVRRPRYLRQRAAPTEAAGMTPMVMASFAPAVPAEVGHAMFAFHSNIIEASSFRPALHGQGA